MGMPIIDAASRVICPHAATVSSTPSQVRVRISGAPALLQTDQSVTAGCPFQAPAPSGTQPSPCGQVQWLTGSVRVRVSGQPVLLQNSQSLCISTTLAVPQGQAIPTTVQARVKAL